MPQRSSMTTAVPVGLVGVLIAAACTASWLSDPLVSSLLWPADINAAIVALLGGELPSPGTPQISLSVVAVLIRLSLLIAVALVAGCVVNRSRSIEEIASDLLIRLGMVGIGCGLLWGIQQFVTDAFALATLPPLTLMLAGAAIYSCLMVFADGAESSTASSRTAWIVLLMATIGWIAMSFRLNERLYANLLIPHGDSAMYEEHLWNIWHGKGFRSYLDQGLFLGEHIQVIHLLLLPIHVIWPSHVMLELAESIALGSCTIPLFLIARRRTGDDWAAALLAMAWLLFFPMHYLDIAIDQKTFRPICLGLPFLFWMIQATETGRFRTAWFCLLLALSAKEDMALITGPIAAVLAISVWRGSEEQKRLKTWGIAAACFSLLWLVLTVLVVIPAFRSGEVVHYSRYFGELGSSPGELIRTALTRPTLVLAQIFSFRTLLYLCVLLAPLSFIVVRGPLQLAAGVLTFLMLSLLQLGNGPDGGGLPPVPYHHFHAPLLPVLFWAAACALARIRPGTGLLRSRLPQNSRQAALLVLCCCLTTGLSGSLLPTGTTYWSESSGFGRRAIYFPDPNTPAGQHLIRRAEMARIVTEQIPPTARVASTDFIHTRLTHRERSYDYSGYERVVNEEGQRVPADTDYIVIDTGHRYSTIRSAGDIPELQESDVWELLPDKTGGYFLILQRRR